MSSETFLTTFLASFLIWFMFGILTILYVFRKKLAHSQMAHIIAVVVTSLLVSQLIKVILPTERPFIAQGIDPLTLTVPADASFPSSHTTAAFSLAFAVIYHNRKIGALFLPPAALVGAGRVLSHVHYPIDVVGGILVAAFVAIVLSQPRIRHVFDRPWFTS